MYNLFDRIDLLTAELTMIRDELNQTSISKFYDLDYYDMYRLYHILKPKQAEKFIEGWVANHIGGRKIKSSDIPSNCYGRDCGDLIVGEQMTLTENNIELKCIFADTPNISGGQFRFYEPIGYYLFFKAYSKDRYDMFLLSKNELIEEIVTRAVQYNKAIYSSSQGSGVISHMSQEQRIDRLAKNLSGEHQDKISWGFNPVTEPEYFQKFKEKYLVTNDGIKRKFNV